MYIAEQIQLLVWTLFLAVVIGFDEVDYTVDEDAGTVQLFVSVQDGTIPVGVTRRITLTTSDRTASCTMHSCVHALHVCFKYSLHICVVLTTHYYNIEQ